MSVKPANGSPMTRSSGDRTRRLRISQEYRKNIATVFLHSTRKTIGLRWRDRPRIRTPRKLEFGAGQAIPTYVLNANGTAASS
jgi:hypothetical protein